MPALTIVRMVEDEGSQHGIARLYTLLALFHNIRQELVAQLPPLLDDGSDIGVVPRFSFAGSVITYVAGENTKLRPAHIDIIVNRGVHEVGDTMESWHIMTPESKT